MKGLSAHQAKRAPVKAPTGKIVTVYTIGSEKLTFPQVFERVLAVNKDIGESKVQSRLSRGHRTIEALAADQLPHYRPKMPRK